MEKNKTWRYLKYSVGEIFLVVVGILIALGINNWNQDRLNSEKETVIVANIHQEFKENRKQLDEVFQNHKRAHTSSGKIISLFPIESKPTQEILDSLSVYLFYSYGGYTFNPSSSSIDALTSTSSFDIIENDSLRNLLISWDKLVEDYQEEEQNSRAYTWDQYDPFMTKHFDWNFNFKDPRNNLEVL